MAGETVRELVEECLFVRLAVTVGTLRNIAVFVLVACYAGQRPVLAGIVCQFAEYLGMAGAAGARRHILGKRDLQRPVNLMTLSAACQCQPFGM